MRVLRLSVTSAVIVTMLGMFSCLWNYLNNERIESTTVSQLNPDEHSSGKMSSEPKVPTTTTTASTARTTRTTATTSATNTTTTTATKRPSRNNSWTPFYHRARPDGKPDLPRILFWTTVYGNWYTGLTEEGVAELEYRKCPYRCYIANDRRMLNVSDAVVFYGRDIDPEHMPEERASFQKWVYWSLEPPWHCPVHLLRGLNNTINWTMTYRHDSDVLNNYATITKVRPTQQHYSERSLKNTWKRKSKTAVWAVSSCKTAGKREHYIKELQKHLYVDVYGKCGEYKCPVEKQDSCYEMFAKNYFFYLSFENSICKDYVTEKLFKPLLHDIIPVVYGGANYTHDAPPGSYIDALSFESPLHLARHLKKVARDYNLYKRHFQWKGKYNIANLGAYNYCNLCRKLHSEDFKKTSVVLDLYHWWNTTSYCRAWNRGTQKFEY